MVTSPVPAAGAFTVEHNKENEDVLLKHEDKTYLAAIKKNFEWITTGPD